MKKGQGLDPRLVVRVWKEMLQAYENASPPPYPSTRTVAEELERLGHTTYRNRPPSREAVRNAMKTSEEGQALLLKSSGRYKSGGKYSS